MKLIRNVQIRSHEHQVALVMGLIVLALLAILLGVAGRKVPNDATGAGWCARLGLCFGVLNLGLVGLMVLNPPGSGTARRMEFSSNMRQVALALLEYEQAEGRLPPAVVRDPSGHPLYSWRVLILPDLREYQVDEQFHRDEPWDSPHNIALLRSMPLTFERPGDESYREGRTSIEAVSGPGTAFEGIGQPFNNPDGTNHFPNGVDRTLMLVEAEESVPWTSPTEVILQPGQAIPPLGGGFHRDRFWIGPPDAPTHFMAAFADGGTRSLPRSLGVEAIRALATRNGGEPSGLDGLP